MRVAAEVTEEHAFNITCPRGITIIKRPGKHVKIT
jgi:hypothetical protein